MQALSDVIVVAQIELAEALFDYPEDVERPREFPAQNGQCLLVGRLRTLAAKLVPPPPPRWMRVLCVAWIVWCGVTKSAAPWVVGQDSMQGALDALLILTA
jgi:hypothetical protein